VVSVERLADTGEDEADDGAEDIADDDAAEGGDAPDTPET
jgi:hypothetical protein